MVMVTKALLDHNPDPTRDEIVDALSGNVCRCTGYLPIIEAIQAAAEGTGGRSRGRAAAQAAGSEEDRS
jgi:aerobic carbon-monoxide dehydrogenase small subunit